MKTMKTNIRVGRTLAASLLATFLLVPGAAPAFATGGITVVEGEGIEAQATTSFSDVTNNTAHADDIYWLARTEISMGWAKADGTAEFRPAAAVARADMAAFLYRLANRLGLIKGGWRPSNTAVFTDVTSNTAHANEIWWLAENKISTGWDVGGTKQFRPYATVARQDMAAFLFRLAKLAKLGGASDSWSATGYARSMFTDVDAASSTNHHVEVWWLAQTGISEGWAVGSKREFRGLRSVARQDMAAFLHRLHGLRNDDVVTPEIPI